MKMKILVTTPTGKIGRRVVREMLAPEFSVRVIVREPARLPDDILEQVEVIRGSTDDAAILSKALDDVEALFWCVPPAPLHSRDVRGHYDRFASAASRAIKETATPRVVTISGVGKGLSRNAGPLSGLHAMEEIINESTAVVRHLRCGLFMENLLLQKEFIRERGLMSYPVPGHIPLPMVARRDIADVALRWLVRRDWKGKQGVAVHGPEHLTFNQVAAIIERVLERPVRYSEASVDQFVRTLLNSGASPEYARDLVSLFSELARGVCRAEPRTFDSSTPTSLADWSESELVEPGECDGFREAEMASASSCES
jgi:uncharacterized protein YbjT (DUF2867 family)